MEKGKINVQTENIFPIIKKFLYSDHEIFLRELVANAVDATQKLKTLASLGEFKGEMGSTLIEVSVDKDKKTVTIKDRGIGMTDEEVVKYIAQIAFSGAEEFVSKYKEKAEGQIIGHFGLGFFSAFMVAKKVEIFTLSFKEGAKGVRWECDGNPEYVMEEFDKSDRGTEIVLHIAEDSEEFLEKSRIDGLLKKYCRFLPVEIKSGTYKAYPKEYLEKSEEEQEKDEKDGKKPEMVDTDYIVNNPSPAWTKKPSDLKEEDYEKFYRELYPESFDKPLFHIHINVDYPFNLTGILFFPKIGNSFELNKEKIQLYCRQVFVTEAVENIVPDFLMLLRGVIDSPDIPLNVSRSYLQADGNVKKISAHVTKKVADKLEELFKKDREEFEKKWDDIKLFVHFGMVSDEKFMERAQKFALLKNTEGKYFTLEEYKEKVKPIQTNNSNKIVHIYTTNKDEQHAYINAAQERSYDVLVFDSPIDSHFINALERKMDDVYFVRVDGETVENLVKKEENKVSKLTEEEKNAFRPVVEECISKEKYMVQFEDLGENDPPMIIIKPEFMRRMKDMQAFAPGSSQFGFMPEFYNLVVNVNNPLVGKILSEKDEEKKKRLTKQAADLALLAQGLLKGEDLTNFVKRSVELIN
ncbi:MAG: molecular chaperone HtpG [Bacteroidota bacterium]